MGLILCRAIGVECLKRYRFSPLEDMLCESLHIVYHFIALFCREGCPERQHESSRSRGYDSGDRSG